MNEKPKPLADICPHYSYRKLPKKGLVPIMVPWYQCIVWYSDGIVWYMVISLVIESLNPLSHRSFGRLSLTG